MIRPRTGHARLALSFAALLLAGALAGPVRAVTRLEGEYQLMMDVRKDQRFFPWDWDSNNNDNYTGANLWMTSTPRRGVETFLKFEADWRDPENNSRRPEFQFREAHLKYAWEKPDRGVSSYLFFRQDRFWIERNLLEVVRSDQLKNDRYGTNAMGVRADSWGYGGFNTTVIASDFADQYNPAGADSVSRGSPGKTDDAYIVRVRREFMDRALRLGFTHNRKVENQINEVPGGSQVYAFDGRYEWKGVDYSLEYAWSESQPGPGPVVFEDALDRRLPANSVLIAEIRALRLGSRRAGYFNVAPSYWDRGPRWDNRLGDANRDETGWGVNSWYLLPDRAITLTGNYTTYERKAFERRRDRNFYVEAYIEFVNGFTGKAYVRKQDIVRRYGTQSSLEEHDDLFGELQVESRLAWMRVQSKIKDINLPTQKELYSVETSINFTSQLKMYNRFAFGSDPSILRKGIFLQLQYRPTGNMEMFLEYGPSWIGDSNSPVDDGDLEGGGDQADLVKFILKGRF
jgi:hypothetical protein